MAGPRRVLDVHETIFDPGAFVTEGLVWDAENERLFWANVPEGKVYAWTRRGGAALLLHLDRPVGAIALRRDGGVLLIAGRGVELWDKDLRTLEQKIDVEPDTGANRMNDGSCDSAGRLWVGTMSLARTPGTAGLYRVERTAEGLVSTRMLSGVTVSNGIDWSLDGRLMYYADSPTGRVDVFDFDVSAGTIADRRVFVTETDGRPDGLTVDADGYVWVALFSGAAVHRYSPSGELDMTLRLPTSLVTNVAFGGEDLGTLFITTGSGRLTPEERAVQPAAGAVFRCRPGPVGRLPSKFRG